VGVNLTGGPNLFARLHKWAARQDENFLTESLAVVLEQLLILSPEAGTGLIKRLTNGFIDVLPENASSIEIRTQVETEHGRPDLEIRIVHRLSCIEVKAESELRTGQLEGYRTFLNESGLEFTQLVLLTRYPAIYPPDDTRPDAEVRWFDVADTLEEAMPAIEGSGELACFLARQFLDFLEARGMTLTQVGKYLPDGIRALGNFMNMLSEAAAGCKVTARTSAGADYMGVYLDSTKYWLGIYFSEPEKLQFWTRTRIDPDAAARLGVGERIEGESWVPGGYRWSNTADLNSEQIHFFSRTKVSQMQWLEGFVRECLRMARSIETPDQPPIPEEPEGN
jgi:hypothetical protein